MYAIIETGGKQVKVEKGQEIYVEKLDSEPGDKVTFENVLFVSNDGDVKTGTPFVESATVEGTVEKHGRQKKVVTYRYQRRKNKHKKQGHRQPYTKVTIDEINA